MLIGLNSRGCERRLEGYVAQVGARLARPGVEVVNLGLVDSPSARARPATNAAVKTLTFCFSMSPRMRFRIPFCRWCSERASRWWC